MAITSIAVSQDNIVSGSNLMPVHSPLVFVADATYSGVTPDNLYINLYDINDTLLDTFKCIPFSDPSATVRRFIFDSALFLRSYMNDIQDSFQLNNTVYDFDMPTLEFKLKFIDVDTSTESAAITLNALHGAAQYSEYPNLFNIFNNENESYICKKGAFVYLYWYGTNSGSTITIKNGLTTITSFLDDRVGYFRFKYTPTQDTVITFEVGLETKDCTISVNGCDNDIMLKYLDKKGQYRFFNFNEYYETRDASQSIGSIEKLITNIRTDQTNKTQIGKTTDRNISLVAEVENSQLEFLSDLVESPDVYLYVGTLPSDTASDWIEVEVITNDSLIRRRVGTSGRADISIQLPNIHNVTLL